MGKPSLALFPDIHYNISHAEGIAACIVSDFECGIDCERVREYRPNVMKRAFSEKEREIVENDKLAFDHPLAIVSGISRLKNKLEYTDIVFNMMPEYFTLGELQQVYEVILGKKLLDPAFRRIIADKVEKTDKMKIGGGHRPSVLFRYKHKTR